MKNKRSSALVAVFISTFSLVSNARAQDAEVDASATATRDQAARLLDEGNRLYERKDFENALARYREAYATFASPKILFNVGEALRSLGSSAEAANTYADFLGAETIDPNSEASALARARLVELDMKLARLHIRGTLIGVALNVDGKLLAQTNEGVVRVDAGTHDVLATKPGHEPFRARVETPSGEVTILEIYFAATPMARAAPELPRATTVDALTPTAELAKPRDDAPAWWVWVAIGAVVVLGATTAVIVTSSGDDSAPVGELPSTTTADWIRR